MQKFIVKIEDDKAINNSEYECFLIADTNPSLQTLVNKAQAAGKIALVEGQNAVSASVDCGADGAIIDLASSERIKNDIGSAKMHLNGGILGVVCRNRRHEAMVVGENEPDFIIFKVWEDGFEQTLDLSTWYAEFFLIQQAVYPQDDKVDYKKYPADIVIISDTILVAK